MATVSYPEWKFVFLNTDGTWTGSWFKAEWDASIFRELPDGSLVPEAFYE